MKIGLITIKPKIIVFIPGATKNNEIMPITHLSKIDNGLNQ